MFDGRGNYDITIPSYLVTQPIIAINPVFIFIWRTGAAQRGWTSFSVLIQSRYGFPTEGVIHCSCCVKCVAGAGTSICIRFLVILIVCLCCLISRWFCGFYDDDFGSSGRDRRCEKRNNNTNAQAHFGCLCLLCTFTLYYSCQNTTYHNTKYVRGELFFGGLLERKKWVWWYVIKYIIIQTPNPNHNIKHFPILF